MYQLMNWKRVVTEYGYHLEQGDQTLQPVMMTQSDAAPELLNEIICECEDDCDDISSCHQHWQP